jgi:Ca2+-transporting ATPase
MRRSPRTPTVELFSAGMLGWSVLQGMLALLAIAGVYFFAVFSGLPAEDVRSLSFFTLVLGNLMLIVVNRSEHGHPFDFLTGGNPALLGIYLLTGSLLAISVSVPSVRALFGFGPLHADDAAIIAAAIGGLVTLLLLLRH